MMKKRCLCLLMLCICLVTGQAMPFSLRIDVMPQEGALSVLLFRHGGQK